MCLKQFLEKIISELETIKAAIEKGDMIELTKKTMELDMNLSAHKIFGGAEVMALREAYIGSMLNSELGIKMMGDLQTAIEKALEKAKQEMKCDSCEKVQDEEDNYKLTGTC